MPDPIGDAVAEIERNLLPFQQRTGSGIRSSSDSAFDAENQMRREREFRQHPRFAAFFRAHQCAAGALEGIKLAAMYGDSHRTAAAAERFGAAYLALTEETLALFDVKGESTS
jgi:hypothetical protein